MTRRRTRLTPWHQVVRLKEELRSGELALAEFAADLHEVTQAQGRRPIYEEPEQFFTLTYPTHALRELVKDVAGRLAGQSDKAVRQLELTYGGGKTHTLITLYHLFRDPAALPDLPAVREFREHVGADLPRALPIALCFDKIDVERGIDGVRAPDGETRTLRHPWSVLAFQLAGAAGLRAIHGDGRDEERETPPAEPLLVDLIERPQRQGLGTLILVDEVLMYAREKAGMDPVWRDRVTDFFQYLTQAVAKVDRAAIVASLLATDPNKQRGELGQLLITGLFDVFRRQREEGVLPVGKEDVTEVLCRRFFEPDGIRDRSAFRSHVIGVVRGLAKLDDVTAREGAGAEQRFCDSFPFHPELTDVFYSRWTQLAGFQRTRGILRTLATALREAEQWDDSPLVGPAALLAAPGAPPVAEAVRELAGVATAEGGSGDGNRTDWAPLLETELERARQIQDELPALRDGREAEQAVVAVFLHSQPIGHKAYTPEIVRLVGSRAPDAIELEKGLRRWREISWFLDDADAGVDDPSAAQSLPPSWRLGNRPNLRQMHDEACAQRVGTEAVVARLEEAIRGAKSLVEGATALEVGVHLLPAAPRDVRDDGSFRYAVLGPGAVSDSGKPSPVAKRFLDETTGPERPRVHRNAVVLAVPSRDGLEAAHAAVRALLGWEEVQAQLAGHEVDAVQEERLRRRLQEARGRVPEAVRHAYGVVVTVNERNAVHAFRLPASGRPLFTEIKNDGRSRIKETPVDAAALLPDGPYDLWSEDEDARFVKDLAGAFARYPRLPKVLTPKVLLETVLQGVERGLLVGRLVRPDGSMRTWWRGHVDADARDDPQLEVVLPEQAELNVLSDALLKPGVLPELWAGPEGDVAVALPDVQAYFGGGHVVRIPNEEYDEPYTIPRCSAETVRAAVERAVQQGTVWLTSGPTSAWKEPVPYGALDANAVLHPPPEPIAPQDLVEAALPGAWSDGTTNGIALAQALSRSRGTTLPWGLIRDAVKASTASRWLRLAAGSNPVDCAYDAAGSLVLERPPDDSERYTVKPLTAGAVLEVDQIQDLADLTSRLLEASAGAELRFHVRAVLDGDLSLNDRDVVEKLLSEVSEDLKISPGAEKHGE